MSDLNKKQCKICEEWFPTNTEYFYKNKSSKDGLNPYCKTCTRNKTKQWGKDNPEKYKALNRRKSKDRPWEWKLKSREAAKKHREDGRYKQWQQNNKDKVKVYNQKRKHKNHDISKEEWKECLTFFNYSCAYCGISNKEAKLKYNNYLHKEHVDHNGDNDITNCIPACKQCNGEKNIFKMEEWYNETNQKFNIHRLNNIYEWLNKFQSKETTNGG